MSICVEVEEKSYLDQKVDILADLGLNNKEAVKKYLERETKNDISEAARENHIDRLARTLMSNYYDGDRTFVGGRGDKGKEYYETLKASTRKYKIIYENLVIRFVGKKGLRNLLDKKLIFPYRAANGEMAYTIADTFHW